MDVGSSEMEFHYLQQRIIQLNEKMLEKDSEMQEFRHSLAVKESELQSALSDAQQSNTCFTRAKIDLENMEKQVEATEYRLSMKSHENEELKKHLYSMEATKDQLANTYQQALSDLKEQLENSQQIIYQLEDRAGDKNANGKDLINIVRNIREASSLELKRLVNEAKEKHDLTIKEVQMQRDEHVKSITTLSEENSMLRTQVDRLLTELQSMHDKLIIADNHQTLLSQRFENERQTLKLHVRNVEETLQKTQDLLLMKMQDLAITKERTREDDVVCLSGRSDMRVKQPHLATRPASSQLEQEIVEQNIENGNIEVQTNKESKRTTRPVSAPSTTQQLRRLSAPTRLRSARPHTQQSSIKVHNSQQFMQSFGPSPLNKKALEPEHSVQKLDRPCSASMKRFLGPDQGTKLDYFDSIFNDSEGHHLHSSGTQSYRSPFNLNARFNGIKNENDISNAVGSLKILEISGDGSFVEIANTSPSKEIYIGGFMVQQNIGGHPAAVFRFPPRTHIESRSTCKIWSSKHTDAIHNPPTDYLATNIEKWSAGPECTTILCKASGQAVSWLSYKQINNRFSGSLTERYDKIQRSMKPPKYDSSFLKTVPAYDNAKPVLFEQSPSNRTAPVTIIRPKQSLTTVF